jgi:hypothetical protein
MNGTPSHSPKWTYVKIMLICIALFTVLLGALGLALHGMNGLVFFTVFGLVLGTLSGLFGVFVSWWSYRQARSSKRGVS